MKKGKRIWFIGLCWHCFLDSCNGFCCPCNLECHPEGEVRREEIVIYKVEGWGRYG